MAVLKNTFVHFEEAGGEEHADPRITQSMPAGKFAEGLEEEMAAVRMAKALPRPPALCEQALQSDAREEFPPTPDADASLAAMGAPSFDLLAAVFPPAPPTSSPVATAAPVAVPPACWAPAAPPIWPPMTLVLVAGLTNQPEFNGLQGTISSFDAESGRYNVLLEMGAGTQRMAKLRRENLIPQGQPTFPAQPIPVVGNSCKPWPMLDTLDMEKPVAGFGSCLTSAACPGLLAPLVTMKPVQCKPRLTLDALVH